MYATTYGTVSMDVNPSIEYTINRFDRVLRVTGVNEDGQAVLDAMDKKQLLHKTINEALIATVSQLEADGYWNEEENTVVLSSGTGNDEHSAALAASLEEQFSSQTEVYSTAVTREEIASAHEKGMTAGRMRLLDEIERKEPELFREADWADRPVKDLMFAYEHEKGDGFDSSPVPAQDLHPDRQGKENTSDGKNNREPGTLIGDGTEAKVESLPGQESLNSADQPHERSGEEHGVRREENFADDRRQPDGQNMMQPPAAFGPGK